jgi:hypothetical protein
MNKCEILIGCEGQSKAMQFVLSVEWEAGLTSEWCVNSRRIASRELHSATSFNDSALFSIERAGYLGEREFSKNVLILLPYQLPFLREKWSLKERDYIRIS